MFQSWLRSVAWDQGHSAGYEEVINVLEDLLFGFKKAMKAYLSKRIEEMTHAKKNVQVD